VRKYLVLLVVATIFGTENSEASQLVPDADGSRDKPIAIRNAQFISMNSNDIAESMVLIVKNGRIDRILPESEFESAPGHHVIDADGGYVVPGYVDAHYHYRHSDELLNFLAYGVTTILNLGQPLKETRELIALRESIARGEEAGPQIYTTERIIASGIDLKSPEEGRSYVRTLASNGFDFVKIYNEIPQDVFDAVATESKKQGLSIFGHIPRSFSPEYSLSNGLKVVAHAEEFYFTYFEGARDKDLDNFDATQLPDLGKAATLIELLIQNQVAVIPTLAGSFAKQVFWDDEKSVFADPEMRYLHPKLTSLWRSMNILQREPLAKRMLRERIKYALSHEITRRMHDAGVPIVTGTDAAIPNVPPGKSLHRELRELVKTGLDYREAFEATTSVAGQFVKTYVDSSANIGQIKVGYEADLVLLASNPLDNIRNAADVRAVMTDGKWYTSDTISALREIRAERYLNLRKLGSEIRDAVESKSDRAEILDLIAKYNLVDADTFSYGASLVEGIAFEAFSAGNLDEAIRIVKLNSTLFPEIANVWDTLGDVHMHLEQRDRALQSYRRALEIDETFGETRIKIQQLEAAQQSGDDSSP